MKFAPVLLAAVFSVRAFAAPKVGDSATLEGTLEGRGVTTRMMTVQSVAALDAATGVYTVRQAQTIGSQTESSDVAVAGDEIFSEETAAQIVEGCETKRIGKKERVKVPAGKFDTCRISGENAAVLWIAPVPFGVVKMRTPAAAGLVNLGLISITRAN